MTTIFASAATFYNSGLADNLRAAGPAQRARQFVVFTGVACAVTGRRVQRAVSLWKEATASRLENFILELLAAIVLIAIFLIATGPATRDDHDAGRPDLPSSS